MLCIKIQLQLTHLCCAGYVAPSYPRPWVVRVTCHALCEALGFVCAATCYNNTPKRCIVNLFCLMRCVLVNWFFQLTFRLFVGRESCALLLWGNLFSFVE